MKFLLVRGCGGFGDLAMMSRPMLVSQALGNQIGIVIDERWRCLFEDWYQLYVSDREDVSPEWRRINMSKPCPAAAYEGDRVALTRDEHGRARVGKSRIEIFAEAMGQSLANHPVTPYIALSHDRIVKAGKIVDDQKPNIYVQLHAAESYRDWPFFGDLAASLVRKGCKVFVQGGQVKGCEPVEGHLLDAVALMSRCDLVVAPDSFALHAAAAVSVPSVGVFGPIGAEERCGTYPLASTIAAKLPCMPCWRNQRMFCGKNGSSDSWCMSHLYVEYVYRHCIDRLNLISKGIKEPQRRHIYLSTG